MVNVRWTGAAGLEFAHEGRVILIDPYHSRAGKWEIFFGRSSPRVSAVESYLAGLPGALAAVIVGHTHFDHALDIPEFAKRFNGPIIGSASLETLMTACGLPGRVAVCSGGERIELGDGAAVTMIPSRHGLIAFGRVPSPGEIDAASRPPMRASEYRHGAVFMPRLEVSGVVFMDAGSANFIESAIAGQRCDVLFLCVPGWKSIQGYPARLLEELRPKVVVPFHFDDFSTKLRSGLRARTMPFMDMDGFRRAVLRVAPSVEFRVPVTYVPMSF